MKNNGGGSHSLTPVCVILSSDEKSRWRVWITCQCHLSRNVGVNFRILKPSRPNDWITIQKKDSSMLQWVNLRQRSVKNRNRILNNTFFYHSQNNVLRLVVTFYCWCDSNNNSYEKSIYSFRWRKKKWPNIWTYTHILSTNLIRK